MWITSEPKTESRRVFETWLIIYWVSWINHYIGGLSTNKNILAIDDNNDCNKKVCVVASYFDREKKTPQKKYVHSNTL
jgi:hypothetical protein